jgi:tetratricopeptide (TPR) repeat protein
VAACVDLPGRARALARLALALRSHRRFDEAAERVEAARMLFERLGAAEPASMCRRMHDEIVLARARAEHDRAIAMLGDPARFAAALALLSAARPVFVRARAPEAVATCAFNLAYVLQELRRLDDAVEELQQARSIFAGLGRHEEVAGCSQNLGVVLAEMGRYAEARQQLEEARTGFEAVGRLDCVAQCDANLALVHRQIGDARGAARYEGRAFRQGFDPGHLRRAAATYVD